MDTLRNGKTTTIVLTVTLAFSLLLMLFPIQAAAAVRRSFIKSWSYDVKSRVLEIWYDVELLRAGGYGAATYIFIPWANRRVDFFMHDTGAKLWRVKAVIPDDIQTRGETAIQLVGEASDTPQGPFYEVYDSFTLCTEGDIPWLYSISPDYGPAGTQITLNGEDFGDMATQNGEVIMTPFLRSFLTTAAPAPVLSWTDTRIVIQVPAEYTKPQTLFIRVRRLSESGRVYQESNEKMFKLTEGTLPPEQLPPTSRTWAHDSIGVTQPADTWYLAEGCTAGDFETWVLIQNPNPDPVAVDLTFMTGSGPVDGPQDFAIPGNSRHSFKLNLFVSDFDVSTKVVSEGGSVICERAMYGGGRRWAHDSIGVTQPADTWYLAEGCTAGDFETWVLIQNPNPDPVAVDVTYMTGSGPVDGPQDFSIPGNSRISFNAKLSVTDYNVSTKVVSEGGSIICERAMYGGNRTWAHDSIGTTTSATTWYLAEGSTGLGFETWVLIQNPNDSEAQVTLTYMTSHGAGTGDPITLAANSRISINVAVMAPAEPEVSVQVTASQPVIVERAMYGNPK